MRGVLGDMGESSSWTLSSRLMSTLIIECDALNELKAMYSGAMGLSNNLAEGQEPAENKCQ